MIELFGLYYFTFYSLLPHVQMDALFIKFFFMVITKDHKYLQDSWTRGFLPNKLANEVIYQFDIVYIYQILVQQAHHSLICIISSNVFFVLVLFVSTRCNFSQTSISLKIFFTQISSIHPLRPSVIEQRLTRDNQQAHLVVWTTEFFLFVFKYVCVL